MIGVDYSTKFSPWWVIPLFCKRGLIFNVSTFSRHLWRYNSAGWHWVAFHPGIFTIRTSNMRVSEQPTRAHIGESGITKADRHGPVTLLVQPNVSSLSIIRVIFELLWRDYFKFVAVKYGNKLFQVEGKIATLFLRPRKWVLIWKVNVSTWLDFQVFRTSLSPGKKTWGFSRHGKVGLFLPSFLFICEIMYI